MKQLTQLILFIFLFQFQANAQFWKKAKEVVENVGDKISLKSLQSDPVSTSFSDVDRQNTMSISFGSDANYALIHEQPFSEANGFYLQPGFYEAEFDSFCIKAGTYAPTSGSGRFFAPLEGPKADIFETILTAFQEGRVEKQDAQLLFWAIIAKTDFAKMQGRVKATAVRILSTEELARLSTNALQAYGKKQLNKLSYKSKAARAIIDAENKLRSKYYNAVNSYAEYEEIAMLAGVEPVVSGWESGKWTKHPDGYYLRYYPSGYQKTRTQVYVPENAGDVYFDAFGDVAVPAHTSSQRLLQSNSPYGDDNWSGGSIPMSGDINDEGETKDLSCNTVIHQGIKDIIEEEMVLQNISGMTVGVIQNGEFVHLSGHGHGDLLRTEKLTNRSVLKWASISKTLTALATFQLINEKDNFSLGDLVSEHVSYFNPPSTNQSANITLQNLISNRSGISKYGKGLNTNTTNACDDSLKASLSNPIIGESNYSTSGDNDGFNGQSSVSIFGNAPIDFVPGSDYLYSSYGFNLLGAAIDEVADDGYYNYVQNNIADKLNMSSLVTSNNKRYGYDDDCNGTYKEIVSENREVRLPSGGWESNICDLSKLGEAILTGELLPDNRNALWANSYTTPCNVNYRNGIYFERTNSDSLVYHGGNHSNLTTDLEVNLTDSIIVALQIPFASKNRRRIVYRIMNELGNSYNVNVAQSYTCGETCPGSYSGLWRKNGNGQSILRRGLSYDEFLAEFKWMNSQGYRCVDFEPHSQNGDIVWDGVFEKGNWNWGIWRGFSQDGFNAKWKEEAEKGRKLIDLETYREGGKRKWAGLFRKMSGKYALYRKFKTSDFEKKVNDLNNDGYHLIDVEVYKKNGQKFWSGVWVSGGPVIFEHGLTTKEFGDQRKELKQEGYELVDIEHYQEGGTKKWAGVWEKTSEAEALWRNWGYCDFMEKHKDLMDKDYTLIDWEE